VIIQTALTGRGILAERRRKKEKRGERKSQGIFLVEEANRARRKGG
jgi:hypothetical protein